MGVPWAPLGAQIAQNAIRVIKIKGSLKELGADLGGLSGFFGGPLRRPLGPKSPEMQQGLSKIKEPLSASNSAIMFCAPLSANIPHVDHYGALAREW